MGKKKVEGSKEVPEIKGNSGENCESEEKIEAVGKSEGVVKEQQEKRADRVKSGDEKETK